MTLLSGASASCRPVLRKAYMLGTIKLELLLTVVTDDTLSRLASTGATYSVAALHAEVLMLCRIKAFTLTRFCRSSRIPSSTHHPCLDLSLKCQMLQRWSSRPYKQVLMPAL